MSKRILIVEDDELVADHLAALVRDQLGCQPVVSHSHLQGLVLAKDGDCDFGFLDIKLGEESVFPLAAQLRARGVPFVFVSASDPKLVPADLQSAPFFRKPVAAPQLLAAARQHL